MPQAIDEQHAGHDNGADPAGANPPQDPATPASTRGKTKYKVYADSSVLATVEAWASDTQTDPTDDNVWRLKESLPCERLVPEDLIYLGTYSAANKDAAVDMMLADKKPTDRVLLVQLAHAAHLDLFFPTPPVSSLTAVPKEWQQEWTLKQAGRS